MSPKLLAYLDFWDRARLEPDYAPSDVILDLLDTKWHPLSADDKRELFRRVLDHSALRPE